MERNLISWWKNLNHNHKKNFIANYDFNKHNVEINPTTELYNQYKITFGTGIRDRLDSFIVEESNLLELTSLKKLVIKHNSFTDFSHLSYFADLEELYFTNSTVESLDSLQNANLRILTLSCAKLKNLNGVERYENLTKLRLGRCENLDDINCLKNCSALALLDLEYCRSLLLFDQIDQIGEIHVRKNLIYPNEIEYTLYKYKWKQDNSSKPYEFSVDETQFIMENADSRQKNNYVGLIRSNRYEVYIQDFSVWILRRPGYIPALTKESGKTFWQKLYISIRSLMQIRSR